LEVLKGLCNFNPITYNVPLEDDVVDLVEQNLSKEEAGHRRQQSWKKDTKNNGKKDSE
jgi:hypothetical protein